MSVHFGSAERVVLPVPERPKNKATLPLALIFAEQCIGKTPFFGSKKFCAENIDFLISPAYFIPAIKTFFCSKFIMTQLSEFVPSNSGSHSKSDAHNISHVVFWAGLNIPGSIKINLENKLCHAVWVVIFMGT